MVIVLGIIGALILVVSLIAGFVSGSFWGFIFSLTGGIAGSMIFFALAMILDNQERIMSQLQPPSTQLKHLVGKDTCTRCEKEYEKDRTSCPHCAFRPNNT